MKSNLIQALENYTAQRAIVLRGWTDSTHAALDKDYELISETEIMRKATQQVMPFDENLKRVLLKPYVTDQSFGNFRSRFAPRATSENERGQVQALIDHSGFVFTDKTKADQLHAFIRSNFIVSNDRLHRINNGKPTKNNWSVEEVIMSLAQDIVDPDATELNRLEAEAELRTRAQYLAPDEKSVPRVKELLRKKTAVAFPPLPQNVIRDIDEDNLARARAELGVITVDGLTLKEVNQIEIKRKYIEAESEKLPLYNPE